MAKFKTKTDIMVDMIVAYINSCKRDSELDAAGVHIDHLSDFTEELLHFVFRLAGFPEEELGIFTTDYLENPDHFSVSPRDDIRGIAERYAAYLQTELEQLRRERPGLFE